MQLDRCQVIFSIDIDVGSRKLGLMNKGKNDANVSNHLSEYRIGEIEEMALPLFLEMFDDFDIPVTFAVRGQLCEVEESILDTLLDSSVDHDIGAHGYYHVKYADLSIHEAENELNLISKGMQKFGITPKSFVFPANSVSHLDLLEKHNYECYRGYGSFLKDCMFIEKKAQLYNVHPSIFIDQSVKVNLLRKVTDIAVSKKMPFHIWFHPWNFGDNEKTTKKTLEKVFFPYFNYLRRQRRSGLLSSETMLSATQKIKNLYADHAPHI